MQTIHIQRLPSPTHRLDRAIDPIVRMDLLISSAMHFDRRRSVDANAAGQVSVALEMLRDQLLALRRELCGQDLAP